MLYISNSAKVCVQRIFAYYRRNSCIIMHHYMQQVTMSNYAYAHKMQQFIMSYYAYVKNQ